MRLVGVAHFFLFNLLFTTESIPNQSSAQQRRLPPWQPFLYRSALHVGSLARHGVLLKGRGRAVEVLGDLVRLNAVSEIRK